MISRINDNGGTRSGADRRQSPNVDYTPDLRSGKDRRSGVDRRYGQRLRGGQAIERREVFRMMLKKNS